MNSFYELQTDFPKLSPTFQIQSISCPLQILGNFGGEQTFYFRYRYGEWRFEVNHPNSREVAYVCHGKYGDALDGTLTELERYKILRNCIRNYRRSLKRHG